MIDAEKAHYKIAWMCTLLSVPRSSFYAWRNRAETPTAARRRALAGHVRRVFAAGRGAYGCRRVAAQLNREGHDCSVGLIADLMRELGLRACQPRAYKRTTVPGKEPVASADLIGRDFTAPVPGTKLVGDITYLKTGEGWLYLATVTGLATRMVTGWQLARHMRTSLVTDALAMAIAHGHVAPGAIFHSDKGAQYTSAAFARFCAARGVRTSTGRTGVGQRRRRELLLSPEERDVPPAGLPHQSTSPVRRRRLHRGVLQPAAAPLHPRLPDPARSTQRLPDSSSRCMINNQRNCPRSLTQLMTPDGIKVAVFYTKLHNRLLRPLLAADQPQAPAELRAALRAIDQHVDDYITRARLTKSA